MNAKTNALTAGVSGVYCTPRLLQAVRKQADGQQLAWFEINFKAVAAKKSLLVAFSKVLGLPGYFSGNWDALADCLRDFSWRDGNDAGYVLHLSSVGKFSKASPQDFATLLDVLTTASDFWKQRGTPFVVLVDGVSELPILPLK